MDHSCFIQSAFQTPESPDCAGRRIETIEEYGTILGEEFQIVRKDCQSVLADFRVGCVSVFYIDLPVQKRQVTQRMIDPPHVRHTQPISLLKRAPSVVSAEKFMRQPQLQFR